MLALYRSGRQADALEVYQRLRRGLRDDLGIDPSPPLRDLESAILRHDADLDLPSRAIVASPVTPQHVQCRRSCRSRYGRSSVAILSSHAWTRS
jgi:DNA-binding SARP family transcriptional activator